jgi:Big-like domain-containing protein
MASRFRRHTSIWISAGGLAGVGLLGATACGSAFSTDCATTHSCSPVKTNEAAAGDEAKAGGADEAEAGGADEAEAGGGGHFGAGDFEAGAAGAGLQASGLCQTDADCGNEDTADGEEACVVGVCRSGNAPPHVVSITPADGADDAATDATVIVVFSEPLDPNSVTPEAFKLFHGDLEVAGSFQLSANHDELTFKSEKSLDLWVQYRVEVAQELRDVAGAAMLGDVSSSFQVRDGAWSVATLAEAEKVQLPDSLPVNSNGALLTTWLSTQANRCKASGTWVLRGQTQSSEDFKSSATSEYCNNLSASIARDGSAVVGWVLGNYEWSQSFTGDAWVAAERQTFDVGDNTFVSSQVFAHDAKHMTIFRNTAGYGGGWTEVEWGSMTGAWSPTEVNAGGGRVRAAFDADGAGLVTWNLPQQGIYALTYGPQPGVWEAHASAIPGTDLNAAERGLPNVALGAQGDALVLWVEAVNGNQTLKSSRFSPGTGWTVVPAAVSATADGNPLFDAPALVFDGQTFVSAWTGKSGDGLATYSARYDMASGQWHIEEPHLSDLGPSAAFVPRLGADSHGNLMLLWALDGSPMSLAYQRYRAETDEWSSIRAVDGASFDDATFAKSGKLPFALAPNGSGGVLFRTSSAGTETLKLAQFF